MSTPRANGNYSLRFLKSLYEYRPALVLLFSMNIIIVALHIPGPLIISYLFDGVIFQGDTEELIPICITLVALLICIPVLTALSLYLNNSIQHRISFETRQEFIGNLLDKNSSFIQSQRVANLLSRLRDASSARKQIIDILNRLFSNICFLAFVPVFMSFIDWRLTLVALLPLPCLLVLNALISQKITARTMDSAKDQAVMSTLSYESLYLFSSIVKLRIKDKVLRRLKAAALHFRKSDMKLRTLASVEISATGSVFAISFVACIFWGATRTVAGELSIGQLSAFLILASYLHNPLTELFKAVLQWREVDAYAKRYFDVLDEGNPEPKAGDSLELNGIDEIHLIAVNIGFNKHRFLLENVELKFSAGNAYLLGGQSGSGKSTLMATICGDREPLSGTISINQRSQEEYSRASLLSRLVLVPQDCQLFSTSLKNNVTSFRNRFTNKQVREALSWVELSDLESQLEDGLETKLGEGGRQLSYGERKRLVLARFLIGLDKGGVLVIDEGLSNLGGDLAQCIYKNIVTHIQPSILIVVSHEKHLANNVDEVFILRNAKVNRDSCPSLQVI
ncbi:ABC transporter transmembrane domain-containing protein [Agarivorans gilvus]|uniref:ABC transporter transmembrane domain-containing protein n=1 Tax=Agarivorans gilvus TaxID=680279 RepID=UPI0006EC2DE3|nr:ABC transporter ATP-binding protein [Agarivorans gilvus]